MIMCKTPTIMKMFLCFTNFKIIKKFIVFLQFQPVKVYLEVIK